MQLRSKCALADFPQATNLPGDSVARCFCLARGVGMFRREKFGGAAGHFEPVLRSCSQAMS